MEQRKACGRCNEARPVEEFSPDRRTPTGLKSWCKPCCREANREYYERNRAERMAYAAAHKDRKREYDRAYAEANRETRAEQRKQAGAAYYKRLRDGAHTATPRPAQERVGYKGVHSRLFRHLGLASTQQCVDCGESANDWSYNYTDPNDFIESEGRHAGCAYSVNIEHYSPRCRPCHRALDAVHREQDEQR